MLFTPDTINSQSEYHSPELPKTLDLTTHAPYGSPIDHSEHLTGGSGDPLFDDLNRRILEGDATAKFQPITFNWDESDIEAYKADDNFETFGYDPEIGNRNQKRYWEAQTFGDVIGDVASGWGQGFVEGFTHQLSTWKNTASIFQEGDFQAPYTEDVLEEISQKNKVFSQEHRIWTNPDDKDYIQWEKIAEGVQGSGNIFGSVAELVGENVAVGLAIGATFGGAAPTLGAIEAKRVLDFSKATKNTYRLSQTLNKAETLRKSMAAFKESASFKNAWDVAKGAAGYAGDWTTSLGKLTPLGNTAKFVGQDIMNPGRAGAIVSTMGKGFGAVYSDLRDLNLAVSMAQGNASGVQQSIIQEQREEFKRKNGYAPEGLDEQQIQDNALVAAKKDGAFNAFVALYTNKLAFGNILKGNKSIETALAEQGSGMFSNIAVNSSRLAKKTGEKLSLKGSDWGSFRNSVVRGFKNGDNYKSALGHGFGFGLTMSAMETVDNTVKSYFNARYKDEDLSLQEALRKSIDHNFTREGAQTFISGFITGTLMGPLLDKMGGIQEWNNKRILDKRTTPEQKAADLKEAEAFVDKFNDWWKNPLSDGVPDMIAQSKFEKIITNGLESKDQKDVDDTKDLSANIFLVAAARNKLLDVFLEHLNDHVNTLTPKELVEAFHPGKEFTEELHKEVLQKITEFQGQAKDIGRIYNEIWRKFPNPYNPSKYKEGTEEYKREAESYTAYKNAIDIATVTRSTVLQSVERQNRILNGGPLSKGLRGLMPNVSFTTTYNLSHPNRIQEELETLKLERAVAENPAQIDAEISRLENYKNSIVEYATDYQKVLAMPENTDAEIKDKFKAFELLKEKHKPVFEKHLGEILKLELRKNDKEPLSKEDLDKATDLYMDYYKLEVEHEGALSIANFIIDPPNWGRFVDAVKKGREKQAKEAWEDLKKKAEAKRISDEAKKTAEEAEVVTDETKTNPPTPGEDVPEVVTKEKKDIHEKRKTYVARAIDETVSKLEEEKRNNQDTNKGVLEKTEAKLLETQKKLEELVKPSNKGKGARARMVSYLSARTVLQQNLDGLRSIVDMIEYSRNSSKALATTLDANLKHLTEAAQEKDLSALENKLPEYIKARWELDPQRTSHLWIEEAKAQVKIYDKEISGFNQLIQDHMGLIKKLDTLSEIYEAVKDAKSTADYKQKLSNLWAKAQSGDLDKEKSKAIADMLKYVNRLDKLEKVSEDLLYNKELGTVLDSLESLYDELDNFLGLKEQGESKLKELENRVFQIQELDDKIEYLTYLKDLFSKEEKRGTIPTDFNDTDYRNGEGNGEPPVIRVDKDENDFLRKKAFSAGTNYTMTRHYHQEHILAKSVTRIPAHLIPSYKYVEGENGKSERVIDKFYIDHKSRFTDLEMEHLTEEVNKLNEDPNSHETIKNDEVLNIEGNSVLFNKSVSDNPIDLSSTPTFGEIIYHGHPLATHFLDKQAYSEGLGFLVINGKGEYLDKDSNITTNPKEMLFASVQGNKETLEGDLRATKGKGVEAMADWIIKNRTLPNDIKRKDIIEEAIRIRNLVQDMRDGVEAIKQDPTKTLRVRFVGRTDGIFNLEPKIEGKRQEKSVVGVIVEKNYDPIQIKHPNGERLRFILHNGRIALQGMNTGTKWPLENSPLTEEDLDNVINAMKYKSTLNWNKADQREAVDKCNYILNNILFHSRPTKSEMELVKSFLDGVSLTEEQTSILRKLGADRIWEIGGMMYRTFLTPTETGGKKFDIIDIPFTEASIEANKEAFFFGLFAKQNWNTLQGNEGKNIDIIFRDYRVKSRKGGYEIIEKTKPNGESYRNYAEYLINNKYWHTSIVPFSKDGAPQIKQRDYVYDLLRPNVPLNKPIAKTVKKQPEPSKPSLPGLVPDETVTKELLDIGGLDANFITTISASLKGLTKPKVTQLEKGTASKAFREGIEDAALVVSTLYGVTQEEALNKLKEIAKLDDPKEMSKLIDDIKATYLKAIARIEEPTIVLAEQIANPEVEVPPIIQDVPVKKVERTTEEQIAYLKDKIKTLGEFMAGSDFAHHYDDQYKQLEKELSELQAKQKSEVKEENKDVISEATGEPMRDYDLPEENPDEEETPC